MTKSNKRTRKTISKLQNKKQLPVHVVKFISPIKAHIEETVVPLNSVKEKREHKKSLDFLNVDDRSENILDSHFSIQSKSNALTSKNPVVQQNPLENHSMLKFSDIGDNMKMIENKSQDSNLYPF